MLAVGSGIGNVQEALGAVALKVVGRVLEAANEHLI